MSLGHFEVSKGRLTFCAGPGEPTWQVHGPLNLRKLDFSDGLPQLKFVGIILAAVSAPRNLKLNNSIVVRLSPALGLPNFSRAALLSLQKRLSIISIYY